MSKYSGQYDLYDHLSFEKMYNVTQEEFEMLKKITPEEQYKWCREVYKEPADHTDHTEIFGVSDELECFNEFKRNTGGVIYQQQLVKVTAYNQEYIAEMSSGNLIIKPKTTFIKDKRTSNGERRVISCLYEYDGQEYTTLKDLNNHGIWIELPIKINTLLDLIPYYPYTVCETYTVDGREHIIISNNSSVCSDYLEAINNVYQDDMAEYYKKELQNHYIEVVERYFDYKTRTYTLHLPVEYVAPLMKFVVHPGFKIDTSAPIDILENKPLIMYSSPKAFTEDIIDVSDVWPKDELKNGGYITLSVVSKLPDRLYLV